MKANRPNLLEKFKKIKSMIEIVDNIWTVDFEQYDSPFQSYGNIIITGFDKIVDFNRLIDDIWLNDSDLYLQFTRENILKNSLKIISNVENLTLKDIDLFLTNYNNLDFIEYRIYKFIQGAKLGKNVPVKLGPFEILDKNIHKDLIVRDSSHVAENWDILWKNRNENIVISYNIKIKELARGYQISDEYFKKFQNIMKFFVPDYDKGKEICIVDVKEYNNNYSFAINDEFVGKNSQKVSSRIQDIDLNHDFFTTKNNESDYLFSLIGKHNLSEIEKRILISIDWIGSSLSEIELGKTFIQLMFAIEALLNYRSNRIIEPSILSKISEFIAFTIGESLEERIKLEKQFKDLYEIRSAIAHGNEKNVSKADFILLLNLVRRLIWQFIRNDELKSLNKFDNYIKWITNKKYS